MGFLQMNEDFIFIEPLNHTLAVTGHAHRVYRRRRSIHERVTEKPTSRSHYCGVLTGNFISVDIFNAIFVNTKINFFLIINYRFCCLPSQTQGQSKLSFCFILFHSATSAALGLTV